MSVSREDDVKFVGLCEARGLPVLRIGVTDGANGSVEIQDVATWSVEALRADMGATLLKLLVSLKNLFDVAGV